MGLIDPQHAVSGPTSSAPTVPAASHQGVSGETAVSLSLPDGFAQERPGGPELSLGAPATAVQDGQAPSFRLLPGVSGAVYSSSLNCVSPYTGELLPGKFVSSQPMNPDHVVNGTRDDQTTYTPETLQTVQCEQATVASTRGGHFFVEEHLITESQVIGPGIAPNADTPPATVIERTLERSSTRVEGRDGAQAMDLLDRGLTVAAVASIAAHAGPAVAVGLVKSPRAFGTLRSSVHAAANVLTGEHFTQKHMQKKADAWNAQSAAHAVAGNALITKKPRP